MRFLAALVCAAALSGCASTPQGRAAQALELSAAHGWRPQLLRGADFTLQAFVPAQLTDSTKLRVYIEGDGLAWLDRQTPSFAPTPADPLALRLAISDTSGTAVYLARPCQYTLGPDFRNCSTKHWTSHRFAPEMVEAMNQALDQLQQTYGRRELVLIGYSGGAAMAALLSARRQDVVGLVTVAGVLDAHAWTQRLRLSPLVGSLEPRDAAPLLSKVSQWHFIGGQDRVVPPDLIDGFLLAQRATAAVGESTPTVLVEQGFDHRCCWVKAWPELSRSFVFASDRR